MIKSLFYFWAIFIIISSTLSAQSFNYEQVKFKYTLPPKTPFTTEFKTITVRFRGDEHLKRYGILPSELVSKDYKFSRFTNVPEHGDLHLDVLVGLPEYLGAEKDKVTRKENNIDVTYHYYRGTVITPISYELRDGARNLIREEIVYSAGDHINFFSDQYTTPSELESAWEQNQKTVITKSMTEILRKSLAYTATTVKDWYDDQVIEDEITLFDIKKPEKIKAEFLNTAFTKITGALAQNPVISNWDEAKRTEIKSLLNKGTTFSTEDNDERIAYAIAHYDLAALNLYWHDLAAAKKHIVAGKKADRKIYEFESLEKRIPALDNRGIGDAISSKAYTGTYQDGADAKLPAVTAGAMSAGGVDPSGKSKSVDTVFVRNGDKIIGHVTAVHKMRKLGEDQMHDFTHLLISPLNMPQEEIEVPYDQIIYMRHKDTYLIPLPTNIATSLNPPIHLYEPVQLSKNQKLALMRTGYHESMDYKLSSEDDRAFLFTYKDKADDADYEILSVSAGSRYILGLNGALAKDFEFCSTIVANAKSKKYELTKQSLSGLVDDYDGCTNK